MLQVNIGEKGADGKPVYESTNTDPVANIVMGVPNSIRGETSTFGVIVFNPGGAAHMYNDPVFHDNTLSVPLPIGQHAVGVVQTK